MPNPLCQRLVLTMLAVLVLEPAAKAYGSDAVIEELVVFGRAEQRLGVTQAASHGQVAYDDIRLPPLFRVGELVESIPGMVATQHSGTGKANQYFARGFNLDHGTDFSVHVDGVPINMRTHGHGQGYLDLNFIIPELVQRNEFRKGPYSAQVGDFASAASSEFKLYETLPKSLALLTLGEDNYLRGLLAGSTDAGSGTLTGAITATGYDGPWEDPENLELFKGYASYAFDLGPGRMRLALMGYDGSWDSTDQIPERAVEAGLISRYGSIDPTLGGDTSRSSFTVAYDAENWHSTLYVIDYEMTLWSNFTYLLERPDTGDQFEQRDKRRVWGGRVDGSPGTFLGRENLIFRWGGELRYDDIEEVGLYSTTARVRNETLRDDSVELFSAGVYGEVEMLLGERFRTIFGLRGDHFDWDVNALETVNSGTGNDGVVAPKITASYRFSERFEGYANWGRGFHTNDVRGATITVGPDGSAADPSPVVVDSEGAELGVRFEEGSVFNATAVLFALELDSELVYLGDGATTEASDATERVGLELTAFWQAADWLALHSEYTYTDASFKVDQGGGDKIPGAVESTFVLGANARWANGWSASARLRYLGEAPLVEDNSVRSEPSTLLSAGVGWEQRRFAARVDVFNLLNSRRNDISYFYASRLPDEPVDGIEDVHFHPLEPRTVRATVTMRW